MSRLFGDPSPAFLSAVLSDLEALHDEAPPAVGIRPESEEARAYLERMGRDLGLLSGGDEK